jgi:hypothetical protein
MCSTELCDVAIRAIAPSRGIPFRVDCNKIGAYRELVRPNANRIGLDLILRFFEALHDVNVVAEQVVHEAARKKAAITTNMFLGTLS